MEKKVYAIVFYYDEKGYRLCRKVNVLFENEENAKTVAHIICKEKKLYYKIEEFIC